MTDEMKYFQHIYCNNNKSFWMFVFVLLIFLQCSCIDALTNGLSNLHQINKRMDIELCQGMLCWCGKSF